MSQYNTLDEALKETKFFVEANSFERFALWQENKYLKQHSVQWEDINHGWSKVLGKEGEHEINVSFDFAKLNGNLVCFYNPCSNVVNHELVKNWFLKNYPVKYDNGQRRAMTDAQNFHLCANNFKTESLETKIENAINKIELGVRDIDRHKVQEGLDVIDNILDIKWDEMPKLANRYNGLVMLIGKINL